MPKASIFEGKDPKTRFQGLTTPEGGKKLDAKRRELAKIYLDVVGESYGTISDGDVVEYMARGAKDTIAYLKRTKL